MVPKRVAPCLVIALQLAGVGFLPAGLSATSTSPVATSPVAASPAAAQVPRPTAPADTTHDRWGTPPPAYLAALAYLRVADTLAAVPKLRAAIEEAPDFGPAYMRLASILVAGSGEVERVWQGRFEAERLMDRAYRLMRGDVEVLAEYGLLYANQRRNVDGLRLLERVLRSSEVDRLDGGLLANVHYWVGRLRERRWEDWESILLVPTTGGSALLGFGCPRMSQSVIGFGAIFAELAIHCPEEWWAAAKLFRTFEERRARDLQATLDHYRASLYFDPAHVHAAVALLGHLADALAWEEYDDVARRLALVLPDDPRTHLYAGLGLHARGYTVEAQRAFDRGVALLGPLDRQAFEDIHLLVPTRVRGTYVDADESLRDELSRVFFASKNPLFLTDVNERRLEHFARMAWADLKFGAPASATRGWDTERGRIFIRYGAPELVRQWGVGEFEIGRWVFWSYGEQGPNFVFTRQLTYRRAWHTDASAALAEELAHDAPEHYQPRTVTAFHGVPHQVARFRGAEPGRTRLDVYAALPLDSLAIPEAATDVPDLDDDVVAERAVVVPPDSVDAGFFLFDRYYNPVSTQRHRILPAGRPSRVVHYRAELEPGAYHYGIEARATAHDAVPRPVARERAAVEVRGFPAGELAVSDLLLADTVQPRVSLPQRREDLVLVPKTSLALRTGEAVHLYFEVYGLSPGDEGFATYRAELVVEDARQRSALDRVVSRIGQILRPAPDAPVVAWERTVEVLDDVAIEYLRIDLDAAEPGDYVIRITLTDLATGERTEAVRLFQVVMP